FVEVGEGTLVFHEHGLFTVTARSEGLDDVQRQILVLPEDAPDTDEPQLLAYLNFPDATDPSDPLDPADEIHRPGIAPEIVLVAKDDVGVVSATLSVPESLTD